MHAIKEIARAFYKDNEDQRFTEAPPNMEGFILEDFNQTIFEGFFMIRNEDIRIGCDCTLDGHDKDIGEATLRV